MVRNAQRVSGALAAFITTLHNAEIIEDRAVVDPPSDDDAADDEAAGGAAE